MNSTRRRIALILSIGLVLTSVPFTGSHVSAEILPELTEAVEVPDTAEPEYIEGDVIVCLNTGESQSPDSRVASDKAAVIAGLLDEAEDLMDVTEAVKESEESPEADDAVINDKAASDEEYTLKYIHSDEYGTDQLIDMLESDPDVLFAEPNYIYHLTEDIEEDIFTEDEEADKILTETENDTESKTAENLDFAVSQKEETAINTVAETDTASPDFTGLQFAYGNNEGGIDVPYWNNEDYRNADNTVVAVFDSGVDYNHEDLKDVMWDDGLLYSELTALGGGKYGYISVDKNSGGEAYLSFDPMDDQSHGTHCAGSVGAAWNGYGVSGTANGTRIMAVKASDNEGTFWSNSILKGFNYIKTAKEAGVNIVAVNNSWSGGVYSNANALAVRELAELNVVSCFASSNESSDNDYIYMTPTNMRENDGVICVNSNDSEGQKSSFSNYGVRSTDLSSPGTGILSTVPTGTGNPDPDMCLPVKDINGKEVKDDFRHDESCFSYEDINGARHEFLEDSIGRVLKISELPDKKQFLSIKPAPLPEKPEYFAISSKYEERYGLALFVDVLCNDGEFHRIRPSYYISTYYASVNEYRIPDDMNLEDPEIRLYSQFASGKSGKPYYIKAISFVSTRPDYEYSDGTSMATPAVTGEVAVLASAWPGDSAARRAARVIGSTKDTPDLVNTSRTDGIANVRKALACDYVPVVNRAWVDEEGALNVSGYFFGNGTGSVSVISGNNIAIDAQVEEWKGQSSDEWDDDGKNDEDIIKLSGGSEGWPVGEVTVKVTSPYNKTGSRILTVHGIDPSAAGKSFYGQLTVPSPADGDLYKSFMRTIFFSAEGLDGAIYYTGVEMGEKEDHYVLWKYTLPGDDSSPSWEKLDKAPNSSNKSNICAWNRMLVYQDEDDSLIKMYSPKENLIYDTGIKIPGIESLDWSSAYIVNAANELYLLLTLQEEGVDSETRLYRIDMQKKSAYYLRTLGSIQKCPVLTAGKDESGSVIIYSMTGNDDTSVVKEVITVKEDISNSDNEIINLPSNCCFDNLSLVGAANQYGIVLAGPADRGDNGDNFLYSPDDDLLIKCRKQIMPARPTWPVVTEYKGRTYFLCIDMYSEDGITFAYADDDEFRGGSKEKAPLHYYGDDDLGDPGKNKAIVKLISGGDGKVAVGKSIKITPEFSEKDSRKITYTWYSDDAFIATVDQTGKVTGKSAGETHIHAVGRDTAGNEYEGECYIYAYPIATGIKLDAKKMTVQAGDEFTVRASLTPCDALKEGVEWSVSVPSSYLGAVEKTDEGIYPDGPYATLAYATFRTEDVGENFKVTITARTTDGSNKKATCLVTVNKPSPKPEPAPLPVKSAALSDTGTIYLGAGMEHEISLVRLKPADCSGYSVEWKSSSPAVTVSGNEADINKAVIKAANPGNAKITAVITNSAPGGKKTVTVKGLTVKVAQSGLSGNEIKIFNKKKDITNTISGNRLAVGKKLNLKVSVYSDSKIVKTNKTKVVWSSSDPEVATVVNGKVKAYREGPVTFTATLVPTGALGSGEPVSGSCDFYVYNPIKKLSPVTKNVKAASGEEIHVSVRSVVTPAGEGDTIREQKDYIWSSSNPDVVDIQYVNGETAGLMPKKAGRAVITCKAKDGSNKTAKFRVTVYDRVTGIKITAEKLGNATVNTYNEKELTVMGLANKKTFTISPNLEPATTSYKDVVYTSGNPAVLTVSKKGVVKRVGPGAADIYVTTVDGGYTAVCHVME